MGLRAGKSPHQLNIRCLAILVLRGGRTAPRAVSGAPRACLKSSLLCTRGQPHRAPQRFVSRWMRPACLARCSTRGLS
eukprot:163828-Alexandrium_andersonii.AAC.1